MTRKESIDHLKNMLGINGFFGDAEKEALKIAIAALKAEPCEDTISRKAALETIKNLYPDMPVMDIMDARWKWRKKYAPYIECENAIEQLPPVNPIKTVTNAKEAEEYKIRPSEDKKSCDNCKHNADSWDSDACDGCCGANSKWSGEIYPGEFEAMEHNGRMDALVSEEISREEIAALLARGGARIS